jgi:hypothetical protein
LPNSNQNQSPHIETSLTKHSAPTATKIEQCSSSIF